VIAIVDYGMGNLHSVQKAFERVEAQAVVTDNSKALQDAEALVLPGVGAVSDAMTNLRAANLVERIPLAAEEGKPLLGICLGMQLLFEESEELGCYQGLGLLSGRVCRFEEGLKVPHVGWNQIHICRPCPLLTGVADGSFAYFVHSYYVDPAEAELVIATTDYGPGFACVVARGQVFGTQFHPEKSQDVGLRILRNFASLVNRTRSDQGDKLTYE